MRWIMALVIASVLAPLTVWAAPLLTPPALKEGQYVYTIPASFDPKGISRAGLDEIQDVAKSLHFPFYVVIADSIPDLTADQVADARAHNYSESGDDLKAAYAIDKLAEDMAALYPFYKADTSTVFLLSYAPRKFRMLAGSKWKTQLGLEKDALVQYHDNFKRAITGTPKDPKNGIINTMRPFDDYVFDQTDPARIKAREDAAQQAREAAAAEAKAARVSSAKGKLAAAILDVQTTLKDTEYLPMDYKKLTEELIKAQAFDSDDADKIDTATASLLAVYEPIKKYHDEKEHDATMSAIGNTLMMIIIALILGVLFFLWRSRRKQYDELQETFTTLYDKWSEKVANAASKYVDAYADRDNIIGLNNTSGRTKALWDSLSAEIDDIWAGVKGLEAHLKQCKEQAATATMWDMNPLRVAYSRIEEAFDFDTGQVNKEELFGGDTKVIRVIPSEFSKSLRERFIVNAKSWDTLKAAADARLEQASSAFSHKALTDIMTEAEAMGIPLAWYDDHPLAGDDDSDAKVWAELDDLRNNDPIAYKERIGVMFAQQMVIGNRHTTLVKALKSVMAATVDSIPDFGTTFGDASDDPAITMSNARDTNHRLQGELAASATAKDTAKVVKLAADVVALYGQVRLQVAKIEAAIKDAEKDLITAKQAEPVNLREEANAKYVGALKVHANLTVTHDDLESGDRLMKQGKERIKSSEALLKKKRHLDASREAAQALDNFKGATKAFNKAIARVQELDIARAKYIEESQNHTAYAKAYEDRIKRNGGNGRVIQYQFRDYNAPMDFAAEMAAVNATQARWEIQVREARAAEERRQASIRAQEESDRRRRRQAEEDAESARRRASYSSYSSPSYSSSSYSSSSYDSGSSSSWSSDSGSSSSGGSSDGGGGSSSSGGDW